VGGKLNPFERHNQGKSKNRIEKTEKARGTLSQKRPNAFLERGRKSGNKSGKKNTGDIGPKWWAFGVEKFQNTTKKQVVWTLSHA